MGDPGSHPVARTGHSDAASGRCSPPPPRHTPCCLSFAVPEKVFLRRVLRWVCGPGPPLQLQLGWQTLGWPSRRTFLLGSWAWASFRQMVTLHPKSGNREGWMLLFTYVMFGFNCWQCKIILHGSLSKDCLDSMGLWASLWRTVLVVLIEAEGLHTMGSTIPWAE